MSDNNGPVYGIAPLENVARLTALIDRLQNRAMGLPGLGCFHGEPGHGKTTAAIHAVTSMDAIHVECLPVGGVKGLLQMIVKEMGIRQVPRTTEALFATAGDVLAKTQRPLLIDEVDQILSDRAIELIRRLHDVSQAPVILIGEEPLPQKLQRWPRVASRVLSFVGVDPATLRDVDHLARIYAAGLSLAPDLKQAVHAASGGSLRNVATNLAYILEKARGMGISKVDLGAWGDQPFHTGAPPAPRSIIARGVMRRGRAA